MQWFSIQRQQGTPRVAGFYTITGESLVMRLRWPGGGFVWHTPVAVRAQRRGHTEVYRVLDATRLAQVALALTTLLLILGLRREGRETKP